MLKKILPMFRKDNIFCVVAENVCESNAIFRLKMMKVAVKVEITIIIVKSIKRMRNADVILYEDDEKKYKSWS